MSDVVTAVPHSWLEVELGELITVSYGKALAAGNRSAGGRVPVIGSSGTVGYHSEVLVDGPCLVVGRKGAAGAVHLVRESSWPIDTAYFIHPPSGIDIVYLFCLLGTCQLGQLDKSTAIPSLSRDDLYRVVVPVAPSAEQTRIVEKLEELLSDLDAGVAELKAAQKKLAQYRQSLLKAAVEGALTAEWRKQKMVARAEPVVRQAHHDRKTTPVRPELVEGPSSAHGSTLRQAQDSPRTDEGETGAQLLERILAERRARWETRQLAKFKEQGKTPPKDWQKKYPEPVQPDTSDLPELPEGWGWASLDMLGEIASGVAKGTKRDADVQVREVPYLRVANVQRGFLDLSEVKTILATERDIAELTLQAGDVLFNEGGDRDKLGRGWVWRDEVANCIHQNHVFRMRPYLPEVLPELISHHGNTFGKTWFQNAGKQTTNLASINMTMLRMFPVPLGPAEEQRELLNQLDLQIENLNRQEQAVELALKQSTAQRQNILRAAFSGQLVPQDPDDEPASVLLERIRAERAAREAGGDRKRGRKKVMA